MCNQTRCTSSIIGCHWECVNSLCVELVVKAKTEMDCSGKVRHNTKQTASTASAFRLHVLWSHQCNLLHPLVISVVSSYTPSWRLCVLMDSPIVLLLDGAGYSGVTIEGISACVSQQARPEGDRFMACRGRLLAVAIMTEVFAEPFAWSLSTGLALAGHCSRNRFSVQIHLASRNIPEQAQWRCTVA